MTDGAIWFYADAARQPVGPLTQAALIDAVRAGTLDGSTPVWRTGFQGWQPLSACAAELGLVVVPAAAPNPPKPTKLGGCAITAIVIGAFIVLLPFIGIVAAIAIPAYQDYVLRAEIATAVAEADVVRTAIAEQVLSGADCPSNGTAGIGAPDSYASKVVASIETGRQPNGECGLEIVLKSASTHIDRRRIAQTLPEHTESSTTWRCTSDLEKRYLPAQCR